MKSDSSIKKFVDATVFMGMHASDTDIKRKSTSLMSRLYHNQVFMNYEQIGKCDDYVWTFPREIQDKYYPFMDCLHSKMNIKRIPYQESDVMLAMTHDDIKQSGLSSMQSVLIAQVLNHKGILYSHDAEIKNLNWFEKYMGEFTSDTHEETRDNTLFTQELDILYQQSGCLKVDRITLF